MKRAKGQSVKFTEPEIKTIDYMLDLYEKVYEVRVPRHRGVMSAINTMVARLEAQANEDQD